MYVMLLILFRSVSFFLSLRSWFHAARAGGGACGNYKAPPPSLSFLTYPPPRSPFTRRRERENDAPAPAPPWPPTYLFKRQQGKSHAKNRDRSPSHPTPRRPPSVGRAVVAVVAVVVRRPYSIPALAALSAHPRPRPPPGLCVYMYIGERSVSQRALEAST